MLDAVALGGLGLAGAALVVLAAGDLPRATFCAQGVGAGRCSFVADPVTVGLQLVVLLTAVVALLLALDGPGAAGRTTRAEHHALLLAAVTGALALAGARDLATLVVALETASLPVVGLVALRRDADGAQAAMKLLLVAVASLGLLLLGVALIYAGTGSLHLSAVAAATADGGSPVVVLGHGARGGRHRLQGRCAPVRPVGAGRVRRVAGAGRGVPVDDVEGGRPGGGRRSCSSSACRATPPRGSRGSRCSWWRR